MLTGTAAAAIHGTAEKVVAGSLFATAQSAGAGGAGLVAINDVVQAVRGATIGGATVGSAWNWLTGGKQEEKAQEK